MEGPILTVVGIAIIIMLIKKTSIMKYINLSKKESIVDY